MQRKLSHFSRRNRQYLWRRLRRRWRPKEDTWSGGGPFRVYTHWYQPWVVTHEKDIVKNCPGRAIKFIGYEMAGIVAGHAFIKVRRTHAFKKDWSLNQKSPLKNSFRFIPSENHPLPGQVNFEMVWTCFAAAVVDWQWAWEGQLQNKAFASKWRPTGQSPWCKIQSPVPSGTQT